MVIVGRWWVIGDCVKIECGLGCGVDFLNLLVSVVVFLLGWYVLCGY